MGYAVGAGRRGMGVVKARALGGLYGRGVVGDGGWGVETGMCCGGWVGGMVLLVLWVVVGGGWL